MNSKNNFWLKVIRVDWFEDLFRVELVFWNSLTTTKLITYTSRAKIISQLDWDVTWRILHWEKIDFSFLQEEQLKFSAKFTMPSQIQLTIIYSSEDDGYRNWSDFSKGSLWFNLEPIEFEKLTNMLKSLKGNLWEEFFLTF